MSDIKETWWSKFWLNSWYGGLVVSAFISIICFIQTDMYVSEKTGTALWWVLGGVFALAAIYCLYKANKTSTGTGG